MTRNHLGAVCRWLSGFAFCTTTLVGSATAAEPEHSLYLDTRVCPADALGEAFQEALRIEFQGMDPAVVSSARDAELTVCNIRDGQLVVTKGDRVAPIDVADVPELARPRTAAVAVSETLRFWQHLPAKPDFSEPHSATEPQQSGEPASQSPAQVSPGEPLYAKTSSVPAKAKTIDVGLGLRTMVLGPEQSLYWGAGGHLGYRLVGPLRTQLSVGYLSASDSSALGSSSLHALIGSGALELAFGRALAGPHALETHLGVGLSWVRAATSIESNYGLAEPTHHAWAALMDAHVTLVSPLRDDWTLFLGLALVKDLRGVALRAGGEHGISLHGAGVSAETGLQRAF